MRRDHDVRDRAPLTRRRGRAARAWDRVAPPAIGVTSVLIAVAGIAVLVLAGVRLVGSDGRDAALDSLGISSEAFVAAWNDTMEGIDAPFRLPSPAWEPDDAIGLDVASHPIADWALIELYRDDDDEITAVLVTAQPRTATNEDTFVAAATASIAAGLGIDVEAAELLFRDELGADRTGAGTIDDRVVRDGVAVSLQRDGGTWQLRVTVAGDGA